eukprot:11517129-Karenia_brevis.AAC.1
MLRYHRSKRRASGRSGGDSLMSTLMSTSEWNEIAWSLLPLSTDRSDTVFTDGAVKGRVAEGGLLDTEFSRWAVEASKIGKSKGFVRSRPSRRLKQ